jgi:hypothetical protein
MPNMSKKGAQAGCTVDSVIINTAFLIITPDVDYEEFRRSNTHSIAIKILRGHLRIYRYFKKEVWIMTESAILHFCCCPMNSNHPVHPTHHLLPMTTVPTYITHLNARTLAPVALLCCLTLLSNATLN